MLDKRSRPSTYIATLLRHVEERQLKKSRPLSADRAVLELLMYVLTIDCAHLGELTARAAYILVLKVSRHCNSTFGSTVRQKLEHGPDWP